MLKQAEKGMFLLEPLQDEHGKNSQYFDNLLQESLEMHALLLLLFRSIQHVYNKLFEIDPDLEPFEK